MVGKTVKLWGILFLCLVFGKSFLRHCCSLWAVSSWTNHSWYLPGLWLWPLTFISSAPLTTHLLWLSLPLGIPRSRDERSHNRRAPAILKWHTYFFYGDLYRSPKWPSSFFCGSSPICGLKMPHPCTRSGFETPWDPALHFPSNPPSPRSPDCMVQPSLFSQSFAKKQAHPSACLRCCLYSGWPFTFGMTLHLYSHALCFSPKPIPYV